VFVDNLAIVGAPAEPATVVIAPLAVTEVDRSPLPVAVKDAVPVAELRTLKYVTPAEKAPPTRAVEMAVELSATPAEVPKKLTVEVVDAKVIDSPVPSEAGKPAASVSANLNKAPPVEPVIVVPWIAVIVAVVGVEPVANVAVVVVRFAAICAFVRACSLAAVLYAPTVEPT
jgi:hypothetical protein